MQPVTIRHRELSGQTTERVDPGGGVFHPLKDEKVNRPAWIYGPTSAPMTLFTCPVSAIPREVFQLYELWAMCRLTKTLPYAGGFLDQPEIVQRSFPIFEHESEFMARAHAQTAPPTKR